MKRTLEATRQNWESRYRRLGSPDELPWHRDELPDALTELLDAGKVDGPALDVGTGLGVAAAGLLAAGVAVVGLDIAEPALRLASRRASQAASADESVPRSWIAAAAPDLPFASGSFGFVFQRGCMHALEPTRYVDHLMEVARVLVPGGRALLLERSTVLGRFAQQRPSALEVERVRTFDERLGASRYHTFVEALLRRR